MSLRIEPKNESAGEPEFPNGFWPAFWVDTPIAEILECEHTERGTIRYKHDGFIGEWFSEKEALEMHAILIDYVETEEYRNHPYFADRQGQMESMMEFLPVCGGFRTVG